MIVGWLVPLLFLGLLIFGIRKLSSSARKRTGTSFSIRQGFQYLILFGVMIISGVGVSGLLGRVLDFNRVIAENRTDLARNLTFTIVGLPLTYVLTRWTRANFASDPRERNSLAWFGYLTISLITTLSLVINGFHDILSWAIGNDPYSGSALSRSIVWGFVWGLHWQISRRDENAAAGRPQLIAGSAIGLVMLAVGIGGLIGNVIEALINSKSDLSFVESTNPMVNSAINIVVGAPVWYLYWIRHAQKQARELLWYLYVFLAGITASFITAVAATSVAIYEVLVWFFGDVAGKSASEHFLSVSHPIGSALIGGAIWWYHRALLGSKERSEVRRIYEYIVAGVSLIASALGLLMIFVAVVESVTPSEVISTANSSNTLLVAITLLLVGTPLWWFFWNRIQVRSRINDEELTSPTRRIFILMLFGVAGIAAVISIVTAVFFLFDDLLNSRIAWETLRKARFALGILLTNSAISAYHWSIYRHEREIVVRKPKTEKFVVLVGPSDGEVAHELQRRIGGKVQMWDTPGLQVLGTDGEVWDLEKITELIESSPSDELMILNEKRKLRAIPIHRS